VPAVTRYQQSLPPPTRSFLAFGAKGLISIASMTRAKPSGWLTGARLEDVLPEVCKVGKVDECVPSACALRVISLILWGSALLCGMTSSIVRQCQFITVQLVYMYISQMATRHPLRRSQPHPMHRFIPPDDRTPDPLALLIQPGQANRDHAHQAQKDPLGPSLP